MRLIFTNGNLTPEEIVARDTMVYLFNPVLKFLFLTENRSEFIRFGYNSCRQTAIFGAAYLDKLLPDYTFSVYEGSFLEPVNGQIEPYAHAYIVGATKDRYLLIDLSRTSKPLIFADVSDLNFYPRFDAYKDVHKLGHSRINLYSALHMEEPEYYTGMKPSEILQVIDNMIQDIKQLPVQKQKDFCDMIYTETTSLRR